MIWFEAGMDRAGREAGTSWPRAKHFPSSFSLSQQVHIFVQFQDRHIDTQPARESLLMEISEKRAIKKWRDSGKGKI